MDEGLRQVAEDLLASVGFRDEFGLHPLSGGANNRVFSVVSDETPLFLLKEYFHHPEDHRDRLTAEFSFSRFAWEHGIRALPQPLAQDAQHHLGLYEFVAGRRLSTGEISEDVVRQSIDFYCGINRYKAAPEAGSLPKAAEACFSLAQHLHCVERRLQNLQNVASISAVNREACDFIASELATAWQSVARTVHEQACVLDVALKEELPHHDRCLSPSDFGFHNALIGEDGRLRFIDFEYAGWDDPAKLVCDFFCQPAVPVAMDFFEAFVDSVISDLAKPGLHRQCISSLLPVYRIKWCCILLNDFLPTGSARRRFAQGSMDQEAQKAEQLKKARCVLQSVFQ